MTIHPRITKKNLEEIHSSALRFCEQINYDSESLWHLHFLSLYGTVLELAHAIVTTSKNDAPTGVPVLLRSMLEAAIDLRNLVRDQAYGYMLEANALEGKIRLYKHLETDSSAASKEIISSDDFKKRKGQHEARLKEILGKAGDKSSRSIMRRFERAGMLKEYHTVYASLCSEGHNDSTALIRRHIREDSGKTKVFFHREIDHEELADHLEIAASLVVGTTIDIHKCLNSKVAPQVVKDFEELQQKISQSD